MTTEQPQGSHIILLGQIQATVVRHETLLGTVFTVTVCRLETDKDELVEETNFRHDVAQVLDQAYDWITRQQALDTAWDPRVRKPST